MCKILLKRTACFVCFRKLTIFASTIQTNRILSHALNMYHAIRRHAHLLAALMTILPALTALHAEETGELQTVDSLLKVFEHSDKSGKTAICRRLIDIYAAANAFLEEPPQLHEDMSEDSLNLTLYFATERFYIINAYYAEALQYNDRAQETDSKCHPDIHATLLCDRGYCMHKTGRTSEAAKVEYEAMRYCQQTGNLLQLSRAYLYLAIVNHGINDQEQAKSFIIKAIDTNKKLGVNQQTHNALGVATEIFSSAGEVDKAIDYGLQAVEAARAIGFDAGVANHLAQLSYAYDRKGDYQQGLDVAEQAIDIIQKMDIPDRNLQAVAYKFMGWNLLDMGRHAEAAKALEDAVALEREIGNTMGECYDMKAIAEALEPIDPRGAMRALRRYASMADSIHTAQLQEALSQANASFRNDELQEENAHERRMNRIIFFASLAIVLLLAAIAAALWWASRQKSRANRALRQLQTAREHFFTNVTHEFRTPLTVIQGVSQELQKTIPPIGNAEAGAIIERQTGHLLDLVNQLLDISKVQSAIGSQNYRTDNVVAYVGMIVENMRQLAREKNIEMDFDAAPPCIVMDFVPDYMLKLTGNLLANAVKFTPEGGHISVRMQRRKNWLDIQVRDTGIGIAPEHLPHIFEPFYQADAARGNGTGIGLALVQQIVKTLNGNIGVQSEVDEGTTFNISLPIRKSKEQISITPDDGPSHTAAPITTPGRSLSTTTPQPGDESPATEETDSTTLVLVVEDNQDVADYIGRQLRGKYRVAFAADGVEGIAKARELMPDLMITDLMMPHTDGLALCRAIRQDELTNHIPIVIITAKASEEDRIKGLAAGADAYLYKPFNSEELHIRITHLLQQRQLMQQKYARELALTRETPAEAGTEHQPSSTDTPVHPPVPTADDSPRHQAEERFLGKVADIVQQLMPQAEADTDHVASALCMSSSQFRRKLGAITGTTPAQYILHLRLDHARQLMLDHPEWTLAEVADRCGFADQPHFTRVFRRIYGITPRAARQ